MVIKFICYYMICFISMYLHEFGHKIMAKIFIDAKNFKISLGLGSKLVGYKNIIIRIIPLSGYITWEFDEEFYGKLSKWKKVMPSLGGPLVSLIIVVLFTSIFYIVDINSYDKFIKVLLLDVIQFNLFSFIATIIPMKYLDNISDGLRIFYTITDKEIQ